jgi:hypothetical protein
LLADKQNTPHRGGSVTTLDIRPIIVTAAAGYGVFSSAAVSGHRRPCWPTNRTRRGPAAV